MRPHVTHLSERGHQGPSLCGIAAFFGKGVNLSEAGRVDASTNSMERLLGLQ